MPTSVRLDPESEALLRRLAHLSGRTKSEVIRDALHRLAGSSEAAESESIYDAIEDLVGIADEGLEEFASEHKTHFRQKLRRGRRPRGDHPQPA